MIIRLDDLSVTWFRRALCFCWAWTLIVKIGDLRAHYTDEGILPRALLSELPWKFSLNMLSGEIHLQAAIFALALAATAACALNYRPLFSSVVVWLTAISILSRNEPVLNGADHYFAMLLFWNMWLAWPAARSAATAGYTLQIAMLYLFTGLAKIHFEPWRDGTAMRDVLDLDILTRPWSQNLTGSPWLMSFMTRFTVAVELLAPLGLLLGLRFAKIRGATIAVVAALHFGIIAMMKLYFIPVTSLLSLIPLIPASWWKRAPLPVYSWRPAAIGFVMLAIFAMQLLWNLHSLPNHPVSLPRSFKNATQAFRLDQNWSFYAPPPTPGFDGWWVAEGRTADGESTDAWNMKPGAPSTGKPERLSGYYPNQHWTAYFINAADPSIRPLIQGLLPYLCREWESQGTHPPLAEVRLHRYYSINDQEPKLMFSLQQDCPNL